MVIVGFIGVIILTKCDYDLNNDLLFGALTNILCSILYGIYALALNVFVG
jgi:drug/metabolite transporter (DMT)-like permease